MQESLAEAAWRDGLEDDREELWVQFADVAERDGGGDLDAFVPLKVGLLLLVLRLVVVLIVALAAEASKSGARSTRSKLLLLLLHQEDVENVLHSRRRGKAMSCRRTLGADVLQGLAGVEANDVVRLPLVKALDNDVNGVITELPHRVGHLVIQLGRRVEHVLAESGDGAPPDLFIAVSQGVNELARNVDFCQLVVYDSRVPDK